MKRINSSYLYLIITIILWSSTPAIAKLGLGELDNYQLLFYMTIVGMLSLFVVNLFLGKIKLLLTYTKKDYFKMFYMGFLGIFLYHIFLYLAFSLAPAGQVNVVNYLRPIFIVVFSIIILKEKFNYKTIAAILISFLAAILAFTKGSFLNFSNQYVLGYMFATFGAICYGLFSVLGKKFKYDKFSSMFVYYIVATIFIVPTTLVLSGLKIPKTFESIIAILILGGLINSISYVFRFKALKFGHTHKIANLIYLVPFLAMIRTYFLNNEAFEIFSIIALILIVLGIFIQMRNKT